MKIPGHSICGMRSVIFRRTTTPVLLTGLLSVVMSLFFSSCATLNRARGVTPGSNPTGIPVVATAPETLRLKNAKAEDGIVQIDKIHYQQCTSGQQPTARICTGKPISMNHFRAGDYCERLSLGNQRWRLPTRTELESILLKDQYFVPLTDPEAFPATPPTAYWTGSSFHGGNSSFWTVDFQDGHSRGETIFKNAYVRCVSTP